MKAIEHGIDLFRIGIRLILSSFGLLYVLLLELKDTVFELALLLDLPLVQLNLRHLYVILHDFGLN